MNDRAAFAKIRAVIFDMDGVITSESDYWLAAELTVLELLYSKQFLGLRNDVLRTVLFKPGRAVAIDRYVSPNFVALLRNNGINTNWDLAFFSAAMYFIEILFKVRERAIINEIRAQGITAATLNALGHALPSLRMDIEHIDRASSFFRQFLKKFSAAHREAPGDHHFLARNFTAAVNAWLTERTGIDTPLFEQYNPFWQLCRSLFQERYLGDSLYQQEEGERVSSMYKDGLIHFEMPVIPLRRIIDTLGLLRDAGIELGVATGRPHVEIMIPLGNWNLTHFFDLNRIATYREIKAAENMLEKRGAPQSLAKPHPFVYLKSLHPDRADADIIDMPLPIEDAGAVLIVGDSAADLIAAKTIGCKSAAVMTGVKNLKAIQIMKDLEPDFVLDDMASIKELF